MEQSVNHRKTEDNSAKSYVFAICVHERNCSDERDKQLQFVQNNENGHHTLCKTTLYNLSFGGYNKSTI